MSVKFLRRFRTFVFFAFVAAFSAPSAFGGGVYLTKNVDFSDDGFATPARSGEPFFVDVFERSDVWNELRSYKDALKLELGREFNGQKTLYVSREKWNPNDPDNAESAWNATSFLRPLPKSAAGKRFVAKISACASLRAFAGDDDGTWPGCEVLWYDAADEPCGKTPFLFRAGVGATEFDEDVFVGDVPENAASFELRIGFDQPNLERGDFVAIRSVRLESIDEAASYDGVAGEFVSEVFSGGDVAWDAEIPDGTAVKFQIATATERADAENFPGIPGDFSEFRGPDGTDATFFDAPFSVDAPFFRYKAFLVPSKSAAPILKSVSVNGKNDSRWFLGGDAFAPFVRIVGACAAPTRDVRAPLTLEISDDSPLRPSTLRVEVDGEDATARFVAASESTPENAASTDGSLRFFSLRATLTPEADWTPGLHRVSVAVSDVRGNSIESSKVFYLGDAPTTPQISLRADGTILIGGEPFFPIGIYGVSPCASDGFSFDAAFQKLRDAGLNFAQSYGDRRSDELLAAAEKYGFKLWLGSDYPDERFLEIERNNPTIIAWYIGDDTSLHITSGELCDRNDAVKAADPTRLTTQADVVAGRMFSNYYFYAEGTDAFMPEIYPVRGTGPSVGLQSVAQAIRDVRTCREDARRLGDGPKSIWAILQYFKGWGGWSRFPTFAELNGSVFGSIVGGANGITFFIYGDKVEPERNLENYGAAATPENWETFATVTKRVRELEPALKEETVLADQPTATILVGPARNPLDEPSAAALLKHFDGATYLIAVNSSPSPVKARFELPKKTSGRRDVEVLFEENASATLEDGAIEDEFEGFGVRVYRWEDR